MAGRRAIELPLTQVHLDFHTGEHVPDVGADFDAESFADVFARAWVGQVCVFGKCHHGWSYYPTRLGAMHPALTFDLLGRQIEALHARGIRAPVYLSVGWDERAWRQDPGLAAVEPESAMRDAPETCWHLLCLNRPAYLDRVAAQAAEILDAYPADGLFFDILMQPQPACCCPRCIEQMRARGLDPKDARSAAAFSHEVMREAHARLARALRGRRAGLSFFANSCFTLAGRDLVPYDSHVEVESLPTGGWGYAHLPIMGRFARTLGKPFSGMTARFHQTWGDVGGLKPQAALEQECFHALMLGGACCIGDHLPPGGRPEPAVYERIGAVFAQVQARAPWCRGARPVTQVGLLVPPVHEIPPAAAGAARMLAEAHLLFDVVSPQARLESYEALVLPDEIRLDAELAARLEAYLAQGGKVLATAESGLAESEARFALGAWPVTFSGQARFSRQYLLPGKELRRHIPDMPHALYCSGLEVRARRGAEVLATLGDPYFSRSAERFSGHTEVAMARRTRRPAIVRQGPVVYIQSPLFTAYALTAYPVYRQIVARMLDGLLGSRAVEAALPTTARLSLLQRGRRRIVHLMSYVPERRAAGLDIIEESQPLYHVRLRVRVSRRPGRVYLAPGEVELEHGYGEGFVELSVPEVDGHVMVVLEPARRSRA